MVGTPQAHAHTLHPPDRPIVSAFFCSAFIVQCSMQRKQSHVSALFSWRRLFNLEHPHIDSALQIPLPNAPHSTPNQQDTAPPPGAWRTSSLGNSSFGTASIASATDSAHSSNEPLHGAACHNFSQQVRTPPQAIAPSEAVDPPAQVTAAQLPGSPAEGGGPIEGGFNDPHTGPMGLEQPSLLAAENLDTPDSPLEQGGPKWELHPNGKCKHKKNWKHLRAKQGYTYYTCTFCSVRWRQIRPKRSARGRDPAGGGPSTSTET